MLATYVDIESRANHSLVNALGPQVVTWKVVPAHSEIDHDWV